MNTRLFLFETSAFVTTPDQMLDVLIRTVADRSVGQVFFGNYYLMHYELMGGDARLAIAATDKKYGMPRYSAAKCLAAKRDVDGVVRYLGEIRALGRGQRDRLMTAKTDPAFATVSNDPRFQALFE